VTFLSLLLACAPAAMDTALFEADVGWAEVEPVLREHCVRCHERGGRMDEGVAVDTFQDASARAQGVVCTAVGTEIVDAYALGCAGWAVFSMPSGSSDRAPLDQQQVLARWLELGAPE